jgi:hypothetical protein
MAGRGNIAELLRCAHNDGIVLSLENLRSSLREAERRSNPEDEDYTLKMIPVYNTA